MQLMSFYWEPLTHILMFISALYKANVETLAQTFSRMTGHETWPTQVNTGTCWEIRQRDQEGKATTGLVWISAWLLKRQDFSEKWCLTYRHEFLFICQMKHTALFFFFIMMYLSVFLRGINNSWYQSAQSNPSGPPLLSWLILYLL